MKMRINTVQTQKTILAPVMQQSISILMLSLMDLNFAIEQELQTNPLLEAELPQEFPRGLGISGLPNTPSSQFSNEEEQEIPIIQKESLEDHLLTQLRLEISDPLKQKIGELIIGNLDMDGYLTTGIDEIALLAKTNDFPLVETVLRTIQLFDPLGIASRNIQECLGIQLGVSNSPHRVHAMTIVFEHFDDLCHKRTELIAKKMGIALQNIKEALILIASLEPKPARNYQTAEQTVYVRPDIFVFKDGEGILRVEINKKETPVIRINPLYQKLLNDKNLSEHEQKFIQEKLTNAINFIKSIEQRGETILNISRYIVEHQTEFFEGNTSSLVPMMFKEIAQALNRNESTISRAIHGKYMETPLGIFPLKFFFSQAVNDTNKDISSYNVKEDIKKFIQSEDKERPFSDQDILDYFNKKGLKLARRTINKYRQELGIPPSYLRKQS